MSKFIIVDLTSPKSIPHELQAIVRAFPTPIIPIIKSSEKREEGPFSMFSDYFKYDWVHPVIIYPEGGLGMHCKTLISLAENFCKEIEKIRRKQKKESVRIEDLTNTISLHKIVTFLKSFWR